MAKTTNLTGYFRSGAPKRRVEAEQELDVALRTALVALAKYERTRPVAPSGSPLWHGVADAGTMAVLGDQLREARGELRLAWRQRAADLRREIRSLEAVR